MYPNNEPILLQPGDKVIMNNNYYVSEANKNRIFTVRSHPWNLCGTEVVLLNGIKGGYAVDGLTKTKTS